MPDEPYSDGFLCTFDNSLGQTVGQTEILDSQPSNVLLTDILYAQPGDDPEMTASSVTVTKVTTDANGEIVASEEVAYIFMSTA